MLAVVWVLVELWTKVPMVDVRMLVRRPVLVTNLTTVALGYGLFGTWYLVPILVQSPKGVPAEDRPLLGYGFDAIAIALLARSHPFGVVISAILFGAMRNGATKMQFLTQIPVDIISVVQALILLFVAAVSG